MVLGRSFGAIVCDVLGAMIRFDLTIFMLSEARHNVFAKNKIPIYFVTFTRAFAVSEPDINELPIEDEAKRPLSVVFCIKMIKINKTQIIT